MMPCLVVFGRPFPYDTMGWFSRHASRPRHAVACILSMGGRSAALLFGRWWDDPRLHQDLSHLLGAGYHLLGHGP